MSKHVESLYGVTMPTNSGSGLKFTVDNTKKYVSTVPVDTTFNSMQFMVDIGTASPYPFDGRTPSVLQSIALIMPANFALYESPINVLLTIGDKSDTFAMHTNPLLFKRFNLPCENYELDLNEYIDVTGMNGVLGNTGYYMYLEVLNTLKISMLNVPDSYNGLTFGMTFFAKVIQQREHIL